ncbi:MAG TPA: hypothetical protein VL334_24560, partial [Anaerolineae bacterium]|nr:hypothetical protein [Anaerolineae bacterium]
APQILTRLNEIAGTLSKERKYYRIASSILIYTVLGRAMTLSLLAELWGSIVYESRFRRDEALRQLISFDRDRVRMRSSVAAEYILKDIVDPNLTVDVLIEMARTADKLAPINRVYADLRTELMRFRNLNILLPEQGRRATIIRYYESIKALQGSGQHPLFWLQYAIACVTIDEYDRAERYFQTSYALGQARNHWDLYQTNNHYARFLLKKAIFSSDASNCMASFRKARAIINNQIATERRHFPYRVAILYADFYTAFAASLGDKEREEISKAATHVLNRINQLPEDVLKNRYVRECRETLSILVTMEQTGSELDSDSN